MTDDDENDFICEVCGDYDGELTTDPFESDVNGKQVIVVLCKQCYNERCMDI